MKKFIFTCILLLVLGGAWLVYVAYETKRFVDNLPEPPSADTQSATVEVQRLGEPGVPLAEETPPAETSALEEEPPAVTKTQIAAEADLERTAEVSFEVLPDGLTSTKHAEDTSSEEAELTPEEVTPPVHVHGEHCQSGAARYYEGMPEAERYEKMRHDLLARFGDIPEVHIYLRHMRDPGPHPVEKIIEYHEAVATLYPHQRAFMEEQTALVKELAEMHTSGQSH